MGLISCVSGHRPTALTSLKVFGSCIHMVRLSITTVLKMSPPFPTEISKDSLVAPSIQGSQATNGMSSTET
jgi:hypothetical protein